MAKFAVIIAAAGHGERFGGKDKKPLTKLDGRPLFIRAIEPFVNRDDVIQVILAVSPEDTAMVKEKYGANLGFMGVQLSAGGTERWQSVASALQVVRDDVDYVAVHDAARVCVTSDMIDRVFAEATKSGAAILAAALNGTLKRVNEAKVVEETVSRSGLYEAQTPQVFRKDVIQLAYEKVSESSLVTDDAQVVELSGHAVTVVISDMSNIKITYPGDLALAEAILKSRPKPKPTGPRNPFEEAQW